MLHATQQYLTADAVFRFQSRQYLRPLMQAIPSMVWRWVSHSKFVAGAGLLLTAVNFE